jgi:hypothetical protein
MKQSAFINTATLMAAMSAPSPKKNSSLVAPGSIEEEPKRKIASWNWEPLHETYSIPVKYQGAA